MYIWHAIAIVCLLIAAYFSNSRKPFTTPGVLYSGTNFRGSATQLAYGDKRVLHDGTFHFWSCDGDAVIKVTVDGPQVLYLNASRITNLPAAIGGLPSHENYTGIFGSNRRVMIEFISVEQAQQEVAAGHLACATTNSTEICDEEFYSLSGII